MLAPFRGRAIAAMKQKTGVEDAGLLLFSALDQRRDQVCDLQRTASTQPFILSDLPLMEPEPL